MKNYFTTLSNCFQMAWDTYLFFSSCVFKKNNVREAKHFDKYEVKKKQIPTKNKEYILAKKRRYLPSN